MSSKTYFRTFPKIEYKINGKTKTIRDIFTYVGTTDKFKTNTYPFYEYTIKDGERPDHVAFRQYGDSRHYWIILVSNNIRDIWREWPMSQSEFDAYITEQYGDVDTAKNTVHSYYNADGLQVDLNTYIEQGGTVKRIYEYEQELNDAKRTIKLPQPQYLSRIERDFKNLFSE